LTTRISRTTAVHSLLLALAFLLLLRKGLWGTGCSRASGGGRCERGGRCWYGCPAPSALAARVSALLGLCLCQHVSRTCSAPSFSLTCVCASTPMFKSMRAHAHARARAHTHTHTHTNTHTHTDMRHGWNETGAGRKRMLQALVANGCLGVLSGSEVGADGAGAGSAGGGAGRGREGADPLVVGRTEEGGGEAGSGGGGRTHAFASLSRPCVPSPTLSPIDPVPRGLLTLCPAPTDPVGQSWPRGKGSTSRHAHTHARALTHTHTYTSTNACAHTRLQTKGRADGRSGARPHRACCTWGFTTGWRTNWRALGGSSGCGSTLSPSPVRAATRSRRQNV